ncbi:serine/threonine-protein kinase [Demequina subtropica]|uniref:serine/threonine-protein kinase n=1 Tax=Demequina subtropica TaxID=1638989 RepID=UPI0007834DD5|nr:serine/threonine-protein kinase [Demequina subtropica]
MAKRSPLAPPVLPGYSYVRALGSGGFADVFLYRQDMPRREVAVKVLESSAVSAELLDNEVDVMASLSAHPSILTVYEASISADGRPYMVMEFCPGSLSSRYRAEQIPIAEVLSIGIRVASAVEAAHRVGVLHRDIKPSNILTTQFGHPVLADFGVAAMIATVESEDVAMSVPWSAPELVARTSSGSVATEVWALAATVYTLAAGRTPFQSLDGRRDEASHRDRISKARYTPLGRPDVPPALDAVLAGGMRRLPGDRYASAGAFAEALQQVERELGLPVTSLDIPSSGWAQPARSAGAGEAPRGPVRSTVQVESRRTRVATGGSASATERPHRASGRRGMVAGTATGAAIAAAGLAAAAWWVLL